MRLPTRHFTTSTHRFVVLLLGMIAAALFFSDTLLAPPLSAVGCGRLRGGGATAQSMVPITVLILVALFAVQSHGTAHVASFFGPVMVLWFITPRCWPGS